MIIKHISDLHINHYINHTSNLIKGERLTKEWCEKILGYGDILLLGGDYSEWNQQTVWMLEVAAERYKYVLFVTGNHDRWLITDSQRKKYGTSTNRVNELYDLASSIKGVTPMVRKIVTINGLTIAGDGLWYNIKRPEDVDKYRYQSNDSRFIHEGVKTIETPNFLYEQSYDWYRTLEGKEIDMFLSHVPPIHPSISPYSYDACFTCPVEFLAAPVWVCGHSHLREDWVQHDTQFYMNTVGYPTEFQNTLTRAKELTINKY